MTSHSPPQARASSWYFSSLSVTSVAITRTRPCGSALAAGLSAGSMPTIGTAGCAARRRAAATDVAVLQAMTIAFAPSARKRSAIERERSNTSSSVFSP